MISTLKTTNPLIHCITNPISINQCANTVLAVGARPVMAEHPDEVADITKTAKSLVLNLGNITDSRIKSSSISANTAKENNIPFVIDIVGTSCSRLRRDFAKELIFKSPAIIKGNYSEINALYDTSYSSAGVDAEKLDISVINKAAVNLARKHNTIIIASGKTDIVTDGIALIHVNNGTAQLSSVTGTGCMLGMLCGCFLSVSQDINAAVKACEVMGICGELAQTPVGSGSFMQNLLDRLSLINDNDIQKYSKTEVIEIEKI